MAAHSRPVPTHLISICKWFSGRKTLNKGTNPSKHIYMLLGSCIWGTICRYENETPHGTINFITAKSLSLTAKHISPLQNHFGHLDHVTLACKVPRESFQHGGVPRGTWLITITSTLIILDIKSDSCLLVDHYFLGSYLQITWWPSRPMEKKINMHETPIMFIINCQWHFAPEKGVETGYDAKPHFISEFMLPSHRLY